MRTKSLILAAVLCSSVALGQTISFSPGAIIIPEQANFQTPSGSVSAYGLVWWILYGNAPGHYNGGSPVTVYWVVRSGKKSPNRCTPLGGEAPDAGVTKVYPPAPSTGWDDTTWNDGCDISKPNIHNTADQPVTVFDLNSSWPAGGIFASVTVPFITNSSEGYPTYPSSGSLTNLNHTSHPEWTYMQYEGGPFVIDAPDAQKVYNYLKNGDAFVPATFLKQFYTATAGCNATTSPSTTGPDPSCHYVNIHQSLVGFDAPVGRRMNQVPPKLALLDTASSSSGRGGTPSDCSPGGRGGGGSTGAPCSKLFPGILDNYLQNAGLYRTGTAGNLDSGGCPLNSIGPGCIAAGLNGSSAGSPKPGLIYDSFDADADLISTATYDHGRLNGQTAGALDYKVFWTPHWEADHVQNYSAYVANGDGAADQRENALNNIAYFANHKGTGLMAECASLETYEGSDTSGGRGGVTVASPAGLPVASTHFMFTNWIFTNELTNSYSDSTWNGRTCDDPDFLAAHTGQCIVYPNPGNLLSQQGDFRYATPGAMSHVHEWKLDKTRVPVSAYQSGVQRLASSWVNFQSGQFPNDTSMCDPYADNCDNGNDFFSMAYKDNDAQNKATIVYIGVHDISGMTVGNRIILNTLFALGADPVSSARSVSAPIAFHNEYGDAGSGTDAIAFTSIFKAVSGYPAGVDTYTPASGSNWVFPFYPGDEVVHGILNGTNKLVDGENDLQAALVDGANTWDADPNLPSPGMRNIFTYFGGNVSVDLANPAVAAAPNQIRQVGWVPEAVDGTTSNSVIAGIGINDNFTTAPNPNCVDVMGFGTHKGPKGVGAKDGLALGGDGACDLQQAAETATGIVPSGLLNPPNKAALTNDFPNAQQMFQKVRGFCFANSTRSDGDPMATPVLTPGSPAVCNNPSSDNVGHVGGLVFSSPAVIPYSPLLAQTDIGAKRPTMAYAAGYDGMVHAFYVAGGAGYKGPGLQNGLQLHYPYQSPGSHKQGINGPSVVGTTANAKFNNPWVSPNLEPNTGDVMPTGFVPPKPMTELWAFLPPSQIPYISTNYAKIDSAPVVQDVTGDFGNGTQETHTVMVVSAGSPVNGSSPEIFALDVTNPLKPVLLWDLVGSWPAGTYESGFLLTDDHAGGTKHNKHDGNATNTVFQWDETKAHYDINPADSDPGRNDTALYDYSDMGGAAGLTLAAVKMADGTTQSLVFAATASADGTNGIQVYAIDPITGQKAWQWTRHYTIGTGDNVPPAASLYYDDVRVGYVLNFGDGDGYVWQLNPGTGQNMNVESSCGGGECGCPALFTGSTAADPQPVTSLVGVARIPSVQASGAAITGAFAGNPGEEVMVFGTGGENWVYASLSPLLPKGRVHTAFLRGSTHGLPAACAAGTRTNGVLNKPAGFPISLGSGETVWGDITISGETVFLGTAKGPINNLLTANAATAGGTYYLDLGNYAAGSPLTAMGGYSLANYGGVSVLHSGNNDYVVGSEISKVTRTTFAAPGGKGAMSGVASLSVNAPPGGVNGKGILQWIRRRLH